MDAKRNKYNTVLRCIINVISFVCLKECEQCTAGYRKPIEVWTKEESNLNRAHVRHTENKTKAPIVVSDSTYETMRPENDSEAFIFQVKSLSVKDHISHVYIV